MINRELIEALDPASRVAIVSAIQLIAHSGLIESQESLNFARVLAGPADEDPHVLANRIIEHRKSQYSLADFKQLADTVKGMNHA